MSRQVVVCLMFAIAVGCLTCFTSPNGYGYGEDETTVRQHHICIHVTTTGTTSNGTCTWDPTLQLCVGYLAIPVGGTSCGGNAQEEIVDYTCDPNPPYPPGCKEYTPPKYVEFNLKSGQFGCTGNSTSCKCVFTQVGGTKKRQAPDCD
jgi:hypothetical protein